MGDAFTTQHVVEGPNGTRMLMTVEGHVDITRGPLGRFVDLAEQIRSEGLEVPPELDAALALLQHPTTQED